MNRVGAFQTFIDYKLDFINACVGKSISHGSGRLCMHNVILAVYQFPIVGFYQWAVRDIRKLQGVAVFAQQILRQQRIISQTSAEDCWYCRGYRRWSGNCILVCYE